MRSFGWMQMLRKDMIMDPSSHERTSLPSDDIDDEEAEWTLVQPEECDGVTRRSKFQSFRMSLWGLVSACLGPFVAFFQWLWMKTCSSGASYYANKVIRMSKAEAALMEYSSRYGGDSESYEISAFDTKIPRSVVPLKSHNFDVFPNVDNTYRIHAIYVSNSEAPTKTPLVFLHGYLNAAGYFFRNLASLSQSFAEIYSVDVLGSGLSSRPRFDLVDDSREAAELFFVESLEAWRKANNIGRFILAGHSMGGYISVAYAERYPEHLEHLLLISPAGVQADPFQEQRQAYLQSTCWLRVWHKCLLWAFGRFTVGSVFRSMPAPLAHYAIQRYVRNRLAILSESLERAAFVEYLYCNSTFPPSAEACLRYFLTPFTYAQQPTADRIPKLKVHKVSFVYGDEDWMDPAEGSDVQQRCTGNDTPHVQLFTVHWSGHYLMLENYRVFNASVVMAVLGQHAGVGEEQPLIFTSDHIPPPVPFHAIPPLVRKLRFPQGRRPASY